MPITPDPPFPKSAGNPIRSKDWNDAVTELQRLDGAKANRAGDTFTGPLAIAPPDHGANPQMLLHLDPGTLRIEGATQQGAGGGFSMGGNGRFVIDAPGVVAGRFVVTDQGVGSAVGINQPNPRLTLDVGGAIGATSLAVAGTPGDRWGIAVNSKGTNQQQTALLLSADTPVRGSDRLNFLKVGTDGDYQILHKASGFFGRNTLALHCEQGDAIGFYTTGWAPMLEVQGGTGETYIRGALQAGNSDVYFTKTDHNHSGRGNALGWAAIENGSNYGCLMILGRSVTVSPLRRVVGLWDELNVHGLLTYDTLRANSSRALKTAIAPLDAGEAAGMLDALQPVEYALKSDASGRRQLGFIAEETPAVFTDDGHTGVAFNGIVALLTRIVKDQRAAIERLTADVAQLRASAG
jgi:Chaperone of endosialidase